MQRSASGVFDVVYKRIYENPVSEIDDLLRHKLIAVVALLPFLFVDVRAKSHPWPIVGDATMAGGGSLPM